MRIKCNYNSTSPTSQKADVTFMPSELSLAWPTTLTEVLHPQRATANRVCSLISILLVARSQGQLRERERERERENDWP